MIKKSDKINTETRKAQKELQNREIAETLSHIKNKMTGISFSISTSKADLQAS
jgi:hypothetical protein